ncbi:hypothetical protein EV650_2670 [Kribbella kalugense]|uniref:Uncharacterized protein n=1 Tax=Kribbella kalugense TaxID=2512221 RepID=A0A4R8A2G5_9ACTN|nr:hypothetical protein EV650_2670 [Kribbella kalugense]
MTDDTRYVVVGVEKFQQEMHLLRRQAQGAGGAYLHLYRELLREIERLRTGVTDGHHALGYEAGKGDLRDCVTAYLRSDPGHKADYRLVFREIGPREPGQLPRRELLAMKPRRGRNNIYAHVCARLSRHPNDQQPGLNRFGNRRPDARGSQAARQAELDIKRAIAHAWAGQQPLRSTRPLGLDEARSPRGTPHDGPAAQVQHPGQREADTRSEPSSSDPARDRPAHRTGYPQPGGIRQGLTGWPTRDR